MLPLFDGAMPPCCLRVDMITTARSVTVTPLILAAATYAAAMLALPPC